MFLFKTQEKMHQITLIIEVTKSFTAPNLLQLYVVSGVLNSPLWVLVHTKSALERCFITVGFQL